MAMIYHWKLLPFGRFPSTLFLVELLIFLLAVEHPVDVSAIGKIKNTNKWVKSLKYSKSTRLTILELGTG
jgi:hypothetical protein